MVIAPLVGSQSAAAGVISRSDQPSDGVDAPVAPVAAEGRRCAEQWRWRLHAAHLLLALACVCMAAAAPLQSLSSGATALH